MNPLLVKLAFGLDVKWAPWPEAVLIGAGSVLGWATWNRSQTSPRLHVWGSGYMGTDRDEVVTSTDVIHHAVRGKMSASTGNLGAIPLGDPGLLCSRVFPTFGKRLRKGIGIVPHHSHVSEPVLHATRAAFQDITVIDPRQPVHKVIEQIASCEYVLSSSLHGLIVADSYGIPSRQLVFGEPLLGGSFKFEDYYSVFGLSPDPLELHPHTDLRAVVSQLSERQPLEVEHIQAELLEAFPRNELMRDISRPLTK